MSGLSPARRLRTKTTDFSDFFRPSTSHAAPHASTSSLSTSNPPFHDANPNFDPVEMSTSSVHSQSTTKKFSSKLPFLGRSRKKSNVEEGSANAARERDRSILHAGGKHETAPTPHQRDAHSDSHASIHPTKSRDGPQQSLGSKFAAHFTPSRPRKSDAPSRKPSSSHSHSKTRQSPAESGPPDDHTLHPPPKVSARGRSFESTSSGASETGQRSTTPRPSQSQRDSQQPTFTVTLSPPDDLSIYADLFTRPRRKTVDSASQVRVSASSSSSTPPNRDSDDQNSNSRDSSQSTNSGTRFPTPPTPPLNALVNGLIEDYDQTGDLEDTPVRPGSRSSVKSTGAQTHQKTDSADGKNLLSELRFSEDSVIDKERPLPQPQPSSPVLERRRTLSRLSTQSSEKGAVSATSRVGRARSASGSRPSPSAAPPTIPLPSPPTSTGSPLPSPPPSAAPTPPPNIALPSVPTSTSAPSRKSVSSISSISSGQSGGFLSRRIRSHTIPAVPPLIASSTPSTPSIASSPIPPASKPPPSSYSSPASPYLKSLKHDYMATDSEKSDWERSDWDRSDIDDISHATPDQLKQVVLSLKTYVQRIVETHEHERNEMKEKIEALERESIRKDDEIKGLKYLVHRGGGAPFGAASPRAGSPRTSSARSSPLATPSNTSFSDTEKMPTRRRVTIVSGTQSDTGRGGVMTSDSEVDGPSSIPMLPPSLRRNKTTAPAAPRPIAVRSTSTRCIPSSKSSSSPGASPQPSSTTPTTGWISPALLSANKRASTASTFSMASTTSTSSSLLPASSIAPSTISSSLSSIPETPSSTRQSVLPAILQSHHQQVLSTPKPAVKRQPALTPAAAYAANLKTGRPPSISQILERESGASARAS